MLLRPQLSRFSFFNQNDDKLFRFVGVPLLSLVSYLLFLFLPRGYDGHFMQTCFTFIFTGICVWELNRLVLVKVRAAMPELEHTFYRFLLTVFLQMIVTSMLALAITYFEDITDYWAKKVEFKDYWTRFSLSYSFSIVITTGYDGLYIFTFRRQAWLENLYIKQATIQTQIDALRERVSPHFLFNSLNVLSSLIVEDKKRASQFVDDLSSVYRYSLQSYDNQLVTLEHELEFVRSYFFLLKTRFEKGINLKISVNKDFEKRQIPPGTLQLLIDNAIKHNQVSEKHPLSIFIETDDSTALFVTNSLQKKNIVVTGSRQSLTNLMGKFRLMNLPEVVVEQTETFFKVKIPLT